MWHQDPSPRSWRSRWLSAVGLNILIAISFLVLPARAQESAAIAATVNDEVISSLDLDSRITMVVLFSNLPEEPGVAERIAPQIIQTMVDERIKMQEAKRVEIEVRDAAVTRAISRIERQNGMRKGEAIEILQRRNIDKSFLENQIRVDLTWAQLIRELYGRYYRISDAEIDGVLAEMARYAGKKEYHIAEIFLPIDDPARESTVSGNADRLVEQMRAGASFSAVAQNFSQSGTAGIGGDLGWVRPDQLPAELAAALPSLASGRISAPIRAADGIYILLMRGKRLAKGAPSRDATPIVIELQQLLVPVDASASATEVERRMQDARNMTTRVNSCAGLDELGKKIDSPLSGNLGKIALSKLPGETQNRIQELPIGKPSEPFRSGDGVVVLMVCSRSGGDAPALSTEEQREFIRSNLMNERLSVAARQHLRNLKRAAFIDIRVGL